MFKTPKTAPVAIPQRPDNTEAFIAQPYAVPSPDRKHEHYAEDVLAGLARSPVRLWQPPQDNNAQTLISQAPSDSVVPRG